MDSIGTLFQPMSDITLPRNEQGIGSLSNNAFMMNIIGKMEGYKTRLKDLHWAAHNNSTHVRIDEILAALTDYEDAITEDAQATDGDIISGSVRSIPCNSADVFDILDQIKLDLIAIKRQYEGNIEYTGVINETDDFFHTVKKYIYLLRKCTHRD